MSGCMRAFVECGYETDADGMCLSMSWYKFKLGFNQSFDLVWICTEEFSVFQFGQFRGRDWERRAMPQIAHIIGWKSSKNNYETPFRLFYMKLIQRSFQVRLIQRRFLGKVAQNREWMRAKGVERHMSWWMRTVVGECDSFRRDFMKELRAIEGECALTGWIRTWVGECAQLWVNTHIVGETAHEWVNAHIGGWKCTLVGECDSFTRDFMKELRTLVSGSVFMKEFSCETRRGETCRLIHARSGYVSTSQYYACPQFASIHTWILIAFRAHTHFNLCVSSRPSSKEGGGGRRGKRDYHLISIITIKFLGRDD